MKIVILSGIAVLMTLSAQAALPETVLKDGFTVTLKVNCDSVTSNELLYTAGSARLMLRMAGTEIKTPVPPQTHHVKGGEKFERVYRSVAGGPDLRFLVDPVSKTASFADDVPNPEFGKARYAQNVRIGGIRGVNADYDVKIVVYYDAKSCATIFDAKSCATIFDAEIAGQRTLICRRPGRFQAP